MRRRVVTTAAAAGLVGRSRLVEAAATCAPFVPADQATDYLAVAGPLEVLGTQDFETDNSDHRLLYVDVVPAPAPS